MSTNATLGKTLEGRIAAVGGTPLDDTLTKQGFAADAKATGDKISSLQSQFNSAESQMNSAVSSLASSVGTAQSTANNAQSAAAAAQQAVNSLQIGGTNLLLNSDVIYTRDNTATTFNEYSFSVSEDINLQQFIGKNVTASLYAESGGEWVPHGASSNNDRFGFFIFIVWSDSTGTVTGTRNQYLSVNETLFMYAANGRIGKSFTLTPPSGYNTIDQFEFRVQLYAKPAEENDKVWAIGKPKLEMGNTATDWTSAPEDIQAEVSAIKSTTLPILSGSGCIEEIYGEDNYTCVGAVSNWVRIGNFVILNFGFYSNQVQSFTLSELPFTCAGLTSAVLCHPAFNLNTGSSSTSVSVAAEAETDMCYTEEGTKSLKIFRQNTDGAVLSGTLVYLTSDPFPETT